GLALLQLLRQQGYLLQRFETLEAKLASGSTKEIGESPSPLIAGPVAPSFILPDLSGEFITLDVLLSNGKPVLLIFSDPGCGPCNALVPEIGRWQQDYAGKLTLTLISRGTPEANRARASQYGIAPVLLQQDREVAEI